MKLFYIFKPVAIILFSIILLVTCIGEAHALTIEMSLEELSSEAESIIIGNVQATNSYWNKEQTYIYTEVTVSVEQYLKGTKMHEDITIIIPGGKVDGITQYVSNTPAFKPGEKAMLFLNELPPQSIFRQQHQSKLYQVTGNAQGKIHIQDTDAYDPTINEQEERLEDRTEEDFLATQSGFVYNGFCWPGSYPIVNYYVNATSARNTHVQAAADTWSNAGANFSFNYAGTHSRAGKSAMNGINEVMWYDLGSNYVLAVATIWYSGDRILENDMVFNTRFSWSTTIPAPHGHYDVQTVALHEFGHWLSLGHSPIFEAIMYYQIKGIQRHLHSVDIAGIQYIYGAEDLQLEEYSISVSANPEEGGTVSGSGVYYEGHEVTIAAEANEGYIFGEWVSENTIISKNPSHTFNANSDKTISANFYPLISQRISGNNRYHTATEVSKAGWPDGSDIVILTSGLNFPDALAGVPLAYHLGCPILLTPPHLLNSHTKNEIERLNASHVLILGGTGAVSDDIENELQSIVTEVSRLGGTDRFETAVLIAEELAKDIKFDTAFITYSHNFPDALAAASYAALKGTPILLTQTNSLPDSTGLAIDNLGIVNTIVVGGTTVISDSVLESLPNPSRIKGSNRYETALNLAATFIPDETEEILFATGLDFPDALAGSVLAAKQNSGILLVPGTAGAPSNSIIDFILSKNITGVTIFGGEGAVSTGIEVELNKLLN